MVGWLGVPSVLLDVALAVDAGAEGMPAGEVAYSGGDVEVAAASLG